MKIKILILLFTVCQINAQTSYKNISNIVEKTVKKYSDGSTESENLKVIFNNFKTSQSIDESVLKQKMFRDGICVVLNDGELKFQPAKCTFFKDKIDLSAIRSKSGSMKKELDIYVATYINDYLKIGLTKVYRQTMGRLEIPTGSYSSNSSELVLKELETVSFLRKSKKWIFAVSIDSKYKSQSKPRIILYAFRNDYFTKNIFSKVEALKSNNNINVQKKEKTPENYPLYHRIDELRKSLQALVRMAPYSSDSKLKSYVQNLPVLDRYNIRNYIEELTYFSKLKISDKFIIENFRGFFIKNAIANIPHTSTHSLADIYLSNKDFNNTKINYFNAVAILLYKSRSGTAMSRDLGRITYDLYRNAIAFKEQDEASVYLLSLFFDVSDAYNVRKKLKNILKVKIKNN